MLFTLSTIDNRKYTFRNSTIEVIHEYLLIILYITYHRSLLKTSIYLVANKLITVMMIVPNDSN